MMPKWSWVLWTACVLIFSAGRAFAQETAELPQAPSATERPAQDQPSTNQPSLAKPTTNPPHRFFDRTNVILFLGVGASRGFDYASTKNMLGRGREEILLPDDVVFSEGGFPALEAAGALTSVGISYILHRTNHHKLERWMSIGHIGVTMFGVVRNYSLQSKHITTQPALRRRVTSPRLNID